MLGNSWVAAQLAASLEGLSSMGEWVILVFYSNQGVLENSHAIYLHATIAAVYMQINSNIQKNGLLFYFHLNLL
jgi:hypothetical protein